ncbi:MAG: hypothetical protein WC859_10065 [Elusimicrobiota bacterium]|jgi:hypothetical protein
MAYPIAAGSVVSPAYSGTFIPQIWSSKLIEKFYATTVLAAISNTDYEGEIKGQGDLVKIRTVPTLTINDYTAGQSLTNQRPTSSVVELLIDKGKYWSAIADDVMAVQSDIDMMNKWSTDASEQMKISVDRDVLGTIIPSFSASNRGATAGAISANINLGVTGTPLALTKVNIIDTLVDLNEVLSQQNIPEQGRFFVLPFWANSLLKKSDIKDASMSGDGVSVMRNGRVGMIDGTTIYVSNNMAHVADGANSCSNIIAGHTNGLTFASQLVKTETLRAESTFGDIMRGLQVYGYKVIDPTALASAYVYKG